jgi:hypothetical protein
MPRWTVWQTVLACSAVCSAARVLGATLDLAEGWVLGSQGILAVGVAWWGTQSLGGRHG